MKQAEQWVAIRSTSIRWIVGDMLLKKGRMAVLRFAARCSDEKPAIIMIVIGAENLRVILPELLCATKDFNKKTKPGEFTLCSCGLDDSPAVMLDWLDSVGADYFIGGVTIEKTIIGMMGFTGECCHGVAQILRRHGHAMRGF